jgi:hypothetical protein
MAIDYTLSRQAAESLFDAEAILFGENNGVPEFRIVEIFGEWAGAFFEKHTHYNGYFEGGRDYNGWGDCGSDRPMLHYLYRRGFLKVVSEHNYRLTLRAHKTSEAGKVVDHLWEIRRETLEAADREEEQQKAARKAKREAARRVKGGTA